MFRVNGFYGHVRRNDVLSVALFIGFLIGFLIAATAVLLLPLMFFDPARAPMPDPMAYLSSYGVGITLAAAALFLILFRRHLSDIRGLTGFAYVSQRDCPRLHRIAGPLAIAAGIPEPRLGIMPVSALNAFACGLSPKDSVIVVTQGMLDTFDDNELAAVIAHEVTHIVNRDTRLLAAARILLAGVDWIERKNPFRITSTRRLIVFALLPFLLVMALVIGLVVQTGLLIARMTRLAISSARELIADAEAVRLTHDPAALVSALRKLEGRSAIEGLGVGLDAMMIDGAWSGPLATHPPVAERIAILKRLSGGMADAAFKPMAFKSRAGIAPGKPASMSMADRVREGTGRTIFGLTPRMTLAAVAVIVGFQIYAQIGFKMAEEAMGGGAPISSELSQSVPAKIPAAIETAPLR
jgi:Zn-dependent protease with chaperone function